MRLADVADECHRLLKLRAEGKGIDVIEEGDPDLPRRVGRSSARMRQICLNLMSNALKFTPKGGRITLSVGGMPDGGQYLSPCATPDPAFLRKRSPRCCRRSARARWRTRRPKAAPASAWPSCRT